MSYSNPKEDVISIDLTPYGKYLLSVGRLNPMYYAFYDDDIIYDSNYAGISTEGQSQIAQRILNETPRFTAQGVTTGRETDFITVKNDEDKIELLQLAEGLTALSEQVNLEASMLKRFIPYYEIGENKIRQQCLGKYDAKSEFAPAWSVSFLKTPLASATDHLSISGSKGETIDNIPQLNVDIEYTIKRNSEKYNIKFEPDKLQDEPDPTIAPTTVSRDIVSFLRFENGSTIEVLKDFLAIKVEEANTVFEKENFEVEFFEEHTDILLEERVVSKRQFYKNSSDFLEDSLGGRVSVDSVEKKFELLVDEEIDPAIMCPLIGRDKTESFFVTKIFECEGEAIDLDANKVRVNIYDDTDDTKDVCE